MFVRRASLTAALAGASDSLDPPWDEQDSQGEDVVAYYAERTPGFADDLLRCRLRGRLQEANISTTSSMTTRWMPKWESLEAGSSCAAAWPPLPPPRCVVASVAVLPVRLAGFRHTLRSLLRQTRPPDRIFVVIPRRLTDIGNRLSKRTYPDPLPRYLFQNSRVELLRPDEDRLGCLDMLLETLRALKSNPLPGCVTPHNVWLVNDDAIYDAGLLEALLACAARHPDAACGAEGGRGYHFPIRASAAGGGDGSRRYEPFIVAGGEVEVEWLYSSHGILYRTDFFDDALMSFPPDADKRIQLEADWWFAGNLRIRGVRLLQLPTLRRWVRFLDAAQLNSLSLRWLRTGVNPAKNAAILYFAKHYHLWREECAGEDAHVLCEFEVADPRFLGAPSAVAAVLRLRP